MMPLRVCLGPQRPTHNVGEAVRALSVDDEPVAVISAGWQEAEGDLEPVHELVQRPLIDLMLYRRAEEVMAKMPALRERYRARQSQLQALQKLYAARLHHTLNAARDVLQADGDAELLKLEQRHAISQLRTLDRHHLARLKALHNDEAHDDNVQAGSILAAHRDALAERLAQVATVIITGGSLPVLVNRLRLFGLGKMLARKNLVAWSAGAMALSERVVLYHDNAPQGRRDPEIFDFGLGLIENVVLLPDARRRLATGHATRMSLLSRRFAPARCITLDSGARLEFDGGRIVAAVQARRVTRSGGLRGVRPS